MGERSKGLPSTWEGMKKELPHEYDFFRGLVISAFRYLREQGKTESIEKLKELTKVYDLSVEDIYGPDVSRVKDASGGS